MAPRADKGHRRDAAQYFVAAELSRRELVAALTIGNCPNTDILVSNAAGTRFCHVQVKTFVPGKRAVTVGMKAERDYGKLFFWVLAGIPYADAQEPCVYYVVPSGDMARAVSKSFADWVSTPGKKGQQRAMNNKVRTIYLPPFKETTGWSLDPYSERWDLIVSALADAETPADDKGRSRRRATRGAGF